MSGFHVAIRLNVRQETAGALIEAVGPLLMDTGLRLRNGAPGLIEGGNITLEQLGMFLSRLDDAKLDDAGMMGAVEAGVFDDMWVHVGRERPA